MIGKSVDTITVEDIKSLVANQVAESRTLEYKEQLPGNSDDEKKEFLADISSFANASGGDIIYGISELRDANGKTTGLPEEAKGLKSNADAEIRRLESMLQDGLEPRIPGVRTVQIEGFSNGPVIIIRVPKSWNSPHMVVFKNFSRFFARNSAGKYQLDVTEIRSSVIASESLAERIRQFRADRIAKILADETPVPLRAFPKIVLHILPLESFGTGKLIDLAQVHSYRSRLEPIKSDECNHRYNFEGFCTYYLPQESTAVHSYVQAFRNGSLEAVDAIFLSKQDTKVIPKTAYEKELIRCLDKYLSLYSIINVNPPILVMLSLLEVKGYMMQPESWPPQCRQNLVNQEHLLTPEIVVESYDVKASEILRPAFDAVWQACGYARCLNYDDQGNWQERR
jgi:Putative DNA-binding domain